MPHRVPKCALGELKGDNIDEGLLRDNIGEGLLMQFSHPKDKHKNDDQRISIRLIC